MWQLGTVYQSITGKTPLKFKDWPFRKTFEFPSYKEHFQPPEETMVKYTTPGTLDIVVTRFKTWSAIAAQPEDKMEEAALGLKAIVEKGDGLVWIDQAQGTFEVPMACPTIIIRRK